ncbi:MAG: 3-methyladenine DNA glycosylase AlkC [Candidatus Nitrotoga sp. LAW]|nr:MAG: 3-methyladenine DNA glycosylase AlkC [Candidatus Nitrotoga sp. LAW]
MQKGIPLKNLLGLEAIDCLAHNILLVYPQVDTESFCRDASNGLEPLGILERGKKLARTLRLYLPRKYATAIEIILASLTPPLTRTDTLGLAVFFYLPHVSFIAEYGWEFEENDGHDPFLVSMRAQYELTKRFSAEFSMRPFLIKQQERTLSQLLEWTSDPDPHVRRLCSESTRPRLPWAARIPAFITNPTSALPILEALKNDQDLYVRRSVANHLGDIAKDHPEFVFTICERWLTDATNEVKWLIRHALRHPAKKENKTALQLRAAAK